jgi:hypothetical protein
MRRLATALAALLAVAALAGCTEQQRAAYTALTPAQQASVNAGLFVAVDPYIPPADASFLACVRRHESATAGGYRAENPTSTASGAYQFLDSTWRTVSRMAGRPSSHAAWASPADQDAVAAWVLAHPRQTGGRRNWDGTGCR